MAAARIVEPIDILEYRALGLTARVPTIAPDQLGLDGFEERFNHGIVVAISLAAHRDLEAVLFQALLIRVGTILRAAIRMVNAAFGRLAQCHSHVQRPDREILFHAVADSPADDATGVQIKDDGQIQPAFAGPDVADVAGPFLIGASPLRNLDPTDLVRC